MTTPPPGQRIAKWTPARMLACLDGDLELAQELAAIFIDECPRMLQPLRGAVEQTLGGRSKARGARPQRLALQLH